MKRASSNQMSCKRRRQHQAHTRDKGWQIRRAEKPFPRVGSDDLYLDSTSNAVAHAWQLQQEDGNECAALEWSRDSVDICSLCFTRWAAYKSESEHGDMAAQILQSLPRHPHAFTRAFAQTGSGEDRYALE